MTSITWDKNRNTDKPDKGCHNFYNLVANQLQYHKYRFSYSLEDFFLAFILKKRAITSMSFVVFICISLTKISCS